MSVDIRRMSREELDELNVRGRLWRESQKKGSPVLIPPAEATPEQDVTPSPVQAELF
jgi:hypothetical protein